MHLLSSNLEPSGGFQNGNQNDPSDQSDGMALFSWMLCFQKESRSTSDDKTTPSYELNMSFRPRRQKASTLGPFTFKSQGNSNPQNHSLKPLDPNEQFSSELHAPVVQPAPEAFQSDDIGLLHMKTISLEEARRVSKEVLDPPSSDTDEIMTPLTSGCQPKEHSRL